jgi:hypothetical protein
MTTYRFESRVPVARDDVVRTLSARPSIWVRPFLLLAVAAGGRASAPPAARAGRPWYRIGATAVDGDTATVALVWRPDGGEDIFIRFRGRFVIQSDGDGGSTFTLDGQVDGGDAAVNGMVLEALHRLLATALTSAHHEG